MQEEAIATALGRIVAPAPSAVLRGRVLSAAALARAEHVALPRPVKWAIAVLVLLAVALNHVSGGADLRLRAVLAEHRGAARWQDEALFGPDGVPRRVAALPAQRSEIDWNMRFVQITSAVRGGRHGDG